MNETGPVRRVLAILGCHMLLFSAARLTLLVSYPEDFSSLGAGEVALALFHGLRFDLSVVLAFTGVPLLLLALPYPAAARRVWQGAWGWSSWVILCAFAFVLAADLVYFGVVHRHVGPEVRYLGADLDHTIAEVFAHHGGIVAGWCVFCVVALLLWRRILSAPLAPIVPGTRSAIVFLALAAIMLVGWRGTLGSKHLGVVDAGARAAAPHAAAVLTLNGPFTAVRSYWHGGAQEVAFMPWPEAVRRVRALCRAAGDQLLDEDYPLYRRAGRSERASSPPPSPPNVVVVLLESWDARFVDACRRAAGLAPLGATPRFDALARRGWFFPRMYACGQGSLDGLGALLAGLPAVEGLPALGRGVEGNRIPYLGRLARRHGYETWFVSGYKRTSQRMDAIAPLAGFERYLGAEDLPCGSPARSSRRLRAPDDVTLREAAARLGAARRPFLAVVYTASTHRPYFAPDGRRFDDGTERGRYLDTICYADHALGRFFDDAARDGWSGRTLFVLVADHASGVGGTVGRPESLFHIPALILGPGVAPRRDGRVVSQLDLLPTIVALAGWEAAHSSFGRSLADPRPGRALCRLDDRMLVVTSERAVLVRPGDPPGDPEHRTVRAFVQVALGLARRNRLAPRD